MKFLVDENLGKKFTNLLTQEGYDAVFVGDVMRGAPDEKVLPMAESEKRVLITDDKDFGELIFRLKKGGCGVILFRTLINNAEKKFEMVKDVLDIAEDKFIVVSEGRIRIKEL